MGVGQYHYRIMRGSTIVFLENISSDVTCGVTKVEDFLGISSKWFSVNELEGYNLLDDLYIFRRGGITFLIKRTDLIPSREPM